MLRLDELSILKKAGEALACRSILVFGVKITVGMPFFILLSSECNISLFFDGHIFTESIFSLRIFSILNSVFLKNNRCFLIDFFRGLLYNICICV